MSLTDAAHPVLGESLADLVPEDPPSLGPEDVPDDFKATAAATPFVRRMKAVVRKLDVADVLTTTDVVLTMHKAAPLWHLANIEREDHFFAYMAVIGGEPTALQIDHDEKGGVILFSHGPDAQTVTDHPLAVFGQALVPLLFSDPIGSAKQNPRGFDAAMGFVPVALFEAIMHSRQLDVRDVVEALLAEANAVADANPQCRPAPGRSRIEGHVYFVLAMFVELGVIQWQTGPGDRYGTATATPLGFFGNVLLKVHLYGPTPEIDEMVQSAGFLKSEHGYINPRDLPMEVVPN